MSSNTTRDFSAPIDQSGNNPRSLMHRYLAEIVEALSAGFNRKELWSQLRAEGAIHFRYATFCRLLRQLRSESQTATTEPPSLH